MSWPRMRMRSPRTVQQMQPLLVSNSSSSAPITSWWSTPTSPNSFSMTAMRLPCFSLRMRFRSVVLPEPRKPVSTVTGTREGVTDMGRNYRASGRSATAINPLDEGIVRAGSAAGVRVVDDGHHHVAPAAGRLHVTGHGAGVLEQTGLHVSRAGRHVARLHGAVHAGDGQGRHQLRHPL